MPTTASIPSASRLSISYCSVIPPATTRCRQGRARRQRRWGGRARGRERRRRAPGETAKRAWAAPFDGPAAGTWIGAAGGPHIKVVRTATRKNTRFWQVTRPLRRRGGLQDRAERSTAALPSAWVDEPLHQLTAALGEPSTRRNSRVRQVGKPSPVPVPPRRSLLTITQRSKRARPGRWKQPVATVARRQGAAWEMPI